MGLEKVRYITLLFLSEKHIRGDWERVGSRDTNVTSLPDWPELFHPLEYVYASIIFGIFGKRSIMFALFLKVALIRVLLVFLKMTLPESWPVWSLKFFIFKFIFKFAMSRRKKLPQYLVVRRLEDWAHLNWRLYQSQFPLSQVRQAGKIASKRNTILMWSNIVHFDTLSHRL